MIMSLQAPLIEYREAEYRNQGAWQSQVTRSQEIASGFALAMTQQIGGRHEKNHYLITSQHITGWLRTG